MVQSVYDLPSGLALPPIQDLIVGKPTSWQAMPVQWSSAQEPVPVFIRRFSTPREGSQERHVYLFGARYSLLDALVGGEALGDGYFVEYFVVTRSLDGDDWTAHRLLQRESVTFSESDESQDYVPAADVNHPLTPSTADAPAWETTEAFWPTVRGAPMRFVGQAELPENTVTRELLTWGINVYLFWAEVNGKDCFKLVMQETEFQSAREHYEAE